MVLISKANRKAILEHLFKEGVMCVKKDGRAHRHNELEDIPNLHVMMVLKSLASRSYLMEKFSWQWHYYFLTNEGIDYLRDVLHLPAQVCPSTFTKQRAARPALSDAAVDDGAEKGKGNWDFCRFDGSPLAYAEGKSTATDDVLATFIPNEYSRWNLLGPGNPLKLGTWTDADRGITTARPGKFYESINPIFGESRRCFAAVPVETLGECARKCLEEGAPDAETMSTKENWTPYPCVAFAYHRGHNHCVRLPAFASDASYTPMMHKWGGDGWSNYVSKYFATSLKSACPALTLLAIRDKGYAVTRDESNGHVTVRCKEDNEYTSKTNKVSCIADECVGADNKKHPWCFIDNDCETGWVSGCTPLNDQNPLKCEAASSGYF